MADLVNPVERVAANQTQLDQETPESKTSRLAIASLMLGIFALPTVGLTAPVGLVLGILGLRRIRRNAGQLRGGRLAQLSHFC